MFRIVRRDNFSPIVSLFDEFMKNTAVEGFRNIGENGKVGAMALDLVESENDYRIIANLPGISKEDVKVSVDKNYLVLEASHKKEEIDEKSVYQYRERFFGNYRRVIQLPDSVDKNKIKAKMENGLLELVVQKAEEKPETFISIE